ncbi:MAG: type II secretion system F family protein [Kurthia sp.]|nr:type II secretion system F family protein [Candidatus Kurthia equi]
MGKYLPIFLRRHKPLLPYKVQASFIEKFGALLQDGYSFGDAVSMLIPHHLQHIDNIQVLIEDQLREGKSLEDVLRFLGIDEQYLMTLFVAQQSGSLVEGLFLIAKMMKNKAKSKEQLIKLASYPLFLFLFLIILFVCFRQFFLPNMKEMFNRRGSESQLELKISSILLHLPDYLIVLLILGICIALFFKHYAEKKKAGERLLLYYKIPFLKRILQLQLTKQLAFELGSLLEGGLSLQNALSLLKQQPHQQLVAYNADLFLKEIAQGEALSDAILLNRYVDSAFYSFVIHGEQSGNLGKELLILGEFMEERMGNRVEIALQIMQPILFCVIALCILGAYISIMLPMYDMINYV